MPDAYGFTHEPHRGAIYHRCTHDGCTYPGWGITLTDTQRRRHHAHHERHRARELERTRRANLATARRLQRQTARENQHAYQNGGTT